MTKDVDRCHDHAIYCILCAPPGEAHQLGKCLKSQHEKKDVDEKHERSVCRSCGAKHVILSKTVCLDPMCRVCSLYPSYTGFYVLARPI